MPTCEISGKDVPKTIKVRIEGVVMNVAPEHAKLGVVVDPTYQKPLPKTYARQSFSSKPATKSPPKQPAKEETQYLVADYGKKIKQAREAKGLKQEELAKMMMEKASLIHQIESGHLRPDEKLLAKFKHHLGVTLVQTFHDEQEYRSSKTDKMTLGDLLKIKK